MSEAGAALGSTIPIIDVATLRTTPPKQWSSSTACTRVISRMVTAARDQGFFYVVGHGFPAGHMEQLARSAEEFFALPVAEKRRVRMELAGHSWRGWFPVGAEVTSGKVDQKEGIYFGTEDDPGDIRPLRGANLWPGNAAPALQATVTAHMTHCRALGNVILAALASGLGLAPNHFRADFEDPTELFRIFAYPPHEPAYGEDTFAVGEHTDYGYLTVLAQDNSGGLQIRDPQTNGWVDAPPVADSFVVNLGDALEHCTGGLLRATPHRVNKRAGATQTRLSYPYFYDPNFEAPLTSKVPLMAPAWQALAQDAQRDDSAGKRWDGQDPRKFEGTYGTYLMKKVSKVFPELATINLGPKL